MVIIQRYCCVFYSLPSITSNSRNDEYETIALTLMKKEKKYLTTTTDTKIIFFLGFLSNPQKKYRIIIFKKKYFKKNIKYNYY